jgi:hypothetical protein
MANLKERVRKLELGTNDDELVECCGWTGTAGEFQRLLADVLANSRSLPIRHDNPADDGSPEADED